MTSPTLQSLVDSGIKLTPMMTQYFDIKKNYPDALLLFRMGDFYEVFFEDADLTSKVLNIAKTHRGKLGDIPIPMAGIPHHAASTYVDRLTSAGLKVAICEQIEDPKDAVGIVKRAVTQIVTPSLPYDFDKSAKQETHYLAAVHVGEKKYCVVFLDFTTGEFFGASNPMEGQSEGPINNYGEITDLLSKYRPKEIITYKNQFAAHAPVGQHISHMGCLTTHLAPEYFSPQNSKMYLQKLAQGIQFDKVIQGDKELLGLMGVLTYYVSSTQNIESMPHLSPFRLLAAEGKMRVTLATLMGLEILPKNPAQYGESLLGHVDRTKTAMGARNLRKIFLNPLNDVKAITARQNAIEYFLKNHDLLKALREKLEEVRDLERIMAKTATGKALPGDLINFSRGLKVFFELEDTFLKFKDAFLHPQQVIFSSEHKTQALALVADIEKAVNDELGASADKGNLIKEGWNKERDRLSRLSKKVNDELLKLEEKYKSKTGIQKLRIRSNSVAGFFIEVTKSHTSKVPASFERRQTLVNAERYTTPELLEFEKEVNSAQIKLEKLERSLFKEFLERIQNDSRLYQDLAQKLALLDILQGLSWLALQEGLTRPVFNEKKKLCIKEGWHPLIKANLKNAFVAHNLTLDEKKYFALITGPNMAGKTTVMREIAIIQFMAQIGSFVPAKSATLTLVDHLFSRLGASDDIQRGQSTFMVEMAETAEILRHATAKSLIILDEVGRGTSTYDGLSIAWSLVEYFIKELKAFTLFATHYHELIEVVEQLPGGKNMTVDIAVQNGQVQFLYNLVEKGAAQSFGLYVAKLAGLPKSVLARSEKILGQLEEGAEIKSALHTASPTFQSVQLSFLEETKPPQIPEYLKKLEDSLTRVDLTRTTPIEALLKLKEFQDKVLFQ